MSTKIKRRKQNKKSNISMYIAIACIAVAALIIGVGTAALSGAFSVQNNADISSLQYDAGMPDTGTHTHVDEEGNIIVHSNDEHAHED